MKRLDWKLDSPSTLSAQHDGWTYTVTQQPNKWLLYVQPPACGPDWRKWFTTAHLQDAMAIAQALAAGADLS